MRGVIFLYFSFWKFFLYFVIDIKLTGSTGSFSAFVTHFYL